MSAAGSEAGGLRIDLAMGQSLLQSLDVPIRSGLVGRYVALIGMGNHCVELKEIEPPEALRSLDVGHPGTGHGHVRHAASPKAAARDRMDPC